MSARTQPYYADELARMKTRAETAEAALAQSQAALRKKDNLIANVEADRDYYRAIVLGTWPDADALIAMMRARLTSQTGGKS